MLEEGNPGTQNVDSSTMTRADAIRPAPQETFHGNSLARPCPGFGPGLEAGLDGGLSQEAGVSGSLAALGRLLHAQYQFLPTSVRMACSVVPLGHRIACPSFTGPPIQQGMQDRIQRRKKSPLGKEDRCICSPCSAEAARSRREVEMNPLLDCGVRMCSG